MSRDRRDDPRNQLVLELEDGLRAEGALVGLGPEMGAGHRVHELHREAQLRSRLPQAAFHHVARAELLAGGAHVDRLVRVARRRAARDHAQVREARQAGHDVFGQSLGQGREVGVGAAVLERQHRDPEALVGAGGARVGRGSERASAGARLPPAPESPAPPCGARPSTARRAPARSTSHELVARPRRSPVSARAGPAAPCAPPPFAELRVALASTACV